MSRWVHQSAVLGCEMHFSTFIPGGAAAKTPVLYYLSGLTCTDQNFTTKAGAQRAASKAGIALVAPDTSPRGLGIEGEDESYDLGTGAGFYIDATAAPWSKGYKMESYIMKELPEIVSLTLPMTSGAPKSVFGHSMGGHGALSLALKHPGVFRSASAFAPICAPTQCPWGEKAFKAYLGSVDAGKAHDSTELASKYSGPKLPIMIDQGMDDEFYVKKQLLPEKFLEAVKDKSSLLPVSYREQKGYDHSYYFISTFVDDHVNFHASHLKN